MKLTGVAVHNFRALESISIPLAPCSVILGENDIGKTSLLFAIDRFFSCKKLKDSEDFFRRDTEREIEIVVTLKIEEAGPADEFRHADGSVVVRRKFAFDRTPSTEFVGENGESLRPSKAVLEKYLTSANFHFVPATRDIGAQFSFNKTALLGKTLRTAMATSVAQEEAIASLASLTRVMEGSIESHRARLESLLKEQLHNDLLEFSFENLSIDPVDGVNFDVTLSDGYLASVPLRNRGAGTQNSAIIALFRLIAELELGENFILAIEEPENSLHPKAQRQMLSVLQDLSKQVQTIVTTHSPVFVDRSAFEHNIFLTRRSDGNTIAKTFDATILGDIRRTLDIRVSDALLKGGGNCALLVEGRTEEDGFPTFLEILGMSEFALGLSIIPIRGSDTPQTSRICSLLRAYDIPAIVVLDRDATATKADLDRESKASLPNLKGVYCLAKGTIENYYPIEVICEVINLHCVTDREVTPDDFDRDRFDASACDEIGRVLHEVGETRGLKSFKSLLGMEGTKKIKDREIPIDPELRGILEHVRNVAVGNPGS